VLVKIILFGILLIPLLSLGGTYSYFTDTEYSGGNTFTAAVWDTQATFLEVNISKSQLTGNEWILHGTTLTNTGFGNITIDKIRPEWNSTGSTGSASITGIMIKGNTFWSGNAQSGEILDGSDYLLEPWIPPAKITFRFDAEVSGPFTIRFIMGDGAAKSVQIEI